MKKTKRTAEVHSNHRPLGALNQFTRGVWQLRREGHKMDDGSIDPYQPNTACMAHDPRRCRTVVWMALRRRRRTRGNRIEFPSTERGKRQECGGLGVRRVYVRRTVCNGSITLILTMSSGNENTNSTCIRLLAAAGLTLAAIVSASILSATLDN